MSSPASEASKAFSELYSSYMSEKEKILAARDTELAEIDVPDSTYNHYARFADGRAEAELKPIAEDFKKELQEVYGPTLFSDYQRKIELAVEGMNTRIKQLSKDAPEAVFPQVRPAGIFRKAVYSGQLSSVEFSPELRFDELYRNAANEIYTNAPEHMHLLRTSNRIPEYVYLGHIQLNDYASAKDYSVEKDSAIIYSPEDEKLYILPSNFRSKGTFSASPDELETALDQWFSTNGGILAAPSTEKNHHEALTI